MATMLLGFAGLGFAFRKSRRKVAFRITASERTRRILGGIRAASSVSAAALKKVPRGEKHSWRQCIIARMLMA
jgi:hypothetical protein